MTRDEQLIKAALDMAATHARAAFDARSTSRKGHHSLLDWTDGYDEATRACAAAIRAIAPADVLAKVGDERCTKCGHPRSNHPYRHPFVSMGNDLLSTQAAPNAVARLVNALESGKSFAESWIEENGGIDGCDYQDRVSYENICAVLAACKGVRDV